jgi:RimJ/RimL family protein N-acetyltransferase
MTSLHLATVDDVDAVISFLQNMQKELREVELAEDILDNVRQSLQQGVTWFLFRDNEENFFGTCYMQSLHNYWRREKRYYLGGFYIAPSHRGKGNFKKINSLLCDWARENDGVQIYAHIHKDNKKSLGAFGSVGLTETDYRLCVYHWGD